MRVLGVSWIFLRSAKACATPMTVAFKLEVEVRDSEVRPRLKFRNVLKTKIVSEAKIVNKT